MTETCPCGSGQSYSNCCEIFHQGKSLPATAEQLMRSRYCAFAKRLPQYLLDTLHPTQRADNELQKLQQAVAHGQWLGLEVVSTRDGQPQQETGYVAFRARYDESGKQELLEENSRFVKQDGRWFYIDGEFPPTPLPGRNDPCWCGSGKKFKKCHG